jgi:hypothetical protein
MWGEWHTINAESMTYLAVANDSNLPLRYGVVCTFPKGLKEKRQIKFIVGFSGQRTPTTTDLTFEVLFKDSRGNMIGEPRDFRKTLRPEQFYFHKLSLKLFHVQVELAQDE